MDYMPELPDIPQEFIEVQIIYPLTINSKEK